MASLLEVRELAVGYAPRRGRSIVVSSGINLVIGSGEFVCLLGPNGAGKSTLLRTLAGEQKPLAGLVYLNGTSIHSLQKSELARLVSVVLTEKITSSLITVYDLTAMGRIPYTNWLGGLGAEDHRVIAQALAFTGVQEMAGKRLSDLSDGERQRCMLARALAQEPNLLILDEITAFLDLPRRIEMMQRLQQLAHEQGVAVLLSTHDLDLALANADRILLQPKGKPLMDAGPEDLVLSGAFESTFASEGLIFDRLSGSFSRPRAVRGEVYLDAQGIEAYWARRALERRGFACKAGSHAKQPTVRLDDRGQWTLTTHEQQGAYPTLASLLDTLIQAHATSGRS